MAIEHEQSQYNAVRGLLARSDSIKTHFPAALLIELIAAAFSSSVYIYDMAAQFGIGGLLRDIQASSTGFQVVDMETRSGAGLALVGRINGQTSKYEASSSLTAFTSLSGLAQMSVALRHLMPPKKTSHQLVIHVSNIDCDTDDLSFSPSLASLTPVLHSLQEHFVVLLSSTAQDVVDMAKVAYTISDKHVIHIFDHYSSAREERLVILPSLRRNAPAKPCEIVMRDMDVKPFSYNGPIHATSAIVMLSSPLAQYTKGVIEANAKHSEFGLITVHAVKPWDEQSLQTILPQSVAKLYVIDDIAEDATHNGYLFGEVLSSVLDPQGRSPVLHSIKIRPSKLQGYVRDPSSFLRMLQSLIPGDKTRLYFPETKCRKLLFWTSPSNLLSSLPALVSDTFVTSNTVSARRASEYDILSKVGGVAIDRVVLSTSTTKCEHSLQDIGLSFLIPTNSQVGQADFMVITDVAILKSHQMFNQVKENGPILVLSPWTAEEFQANLPSEALRTADSKKLRLYILNTKQIAEDICENKKEILEPIAAYMAFMRLYFGEGANHQLVRTLAEVVFKTTTFLDELVNAVWGGLQEVSVAHLNKPEENEREELQNFEFNSVTYPNNELVVSETGSPEVGSWMNAAKHLMFTEAYGLMDESSDSSSLRPDLMEQTFLVTCTVNRRLTPLEYNRNVFHLEFDTSGTGLKYAIGEALGVHGWNDESDVREFCQWYGIDPDQLISLPVPESGGRQMHSRTVFQALQQQVDIFGRPPKSFYADLAPYAVTREDRMALLFIAAPEGASTFKKLAEKDTVTFADVLERFSSARPPIEVLATLVGDIKPRHYSIASAMSAVGDRVDLLIVTVDWVTPSGSPRYGQCTRYLADLKLGQKVTVSIKPSVMKLPPDDMQPIIMAGLGTGAAPFRAFMQHRALLQSQNKPAGPLLYYFGSRHRSEEYLYGEEIEAYLASSVLTHAGLAFSRDQKKKVYIQHKMKDDANWLVKMLKRENGVFYLCGPTWPVPDVYETSIDALVTSEGSLAEEAAAYLEGLKEEERYVLEVY